MKRGMLLALLWLMCACLPCAHAWEAFLVGEGTEVISRPEEGEWLYISPELNITILRRTDDTPRVWYETHVWASEEEPLRTFVTPGSSPGRRLVNPLAFARENQLVLAITDDFFGFRLHYEQIPGILIREGQVLGSRTYSSRGADLWPNLDTLAVYGDGSMKANASDAHTAQEYAQMGARQVFAFGPVLVSDGQINPQVLQNDYYAYHEPRMAMGMIEPYHYLILTVEGRTEDSVGAKLDWLAQKMLSLGCTEALNLDGGGTAALMFMGEVINRSERNMRSVSSLTGFGRSAEVHP